MACNCKPAPQSQRAADFARFAGQVQHHIDTYTVPQYGDKGDDQVTFYSAADCVKQISKYANRHGRNIRPGQERIDLLKIAHYAQLAADALEDDHVQD